MKRTFLRDIVDLSAMAVQSLEKDDFTTCFEPISSRELDNSGIFYIFSLFIRYLILFPFRLAFLLLSSCIIILIITIFTFMKWNTDYIFILYSKVFLYSFGARIHHHGEKTRLKVPHIYVANHTSFVDFIILSSYKFTHACVSENHGGLFGLLFSSLLKRNGSIAFKRSEKHDRDTVNIKLKDHVANVKNTPMLIFPEGTCVNNKFTVLFQKGSFELDCLICPVAIKFRRNLMDPYWNRRKHNFTEHLCYLMTRWRLEADVWWMKPVMKEDNAADFAMKIKEQISQRGGLKSTLWNGYFKSSPVLRDREILREAYREVYKKRDMLIKERIVKSDHDHRFKTRNQKLDSQCEKIIHNPNVRKLAFNEQKRLVTYNLQKKKLYFEYCTYKEFLDLVLAEYLELKKSKSYRLSMNEGLWWGQKCIANGNSIDCGCGNKNGFLCNGRNCKYEVLDKSIKEEMPKAKTIT